MRHFDVDVRPDRAAMFADPARLQRLQDHLCAMNLDQLLHVELASTPTFPAVHPQRQLMLHQMAQRAAHSAACYFRICHLRKCGEGGQRSSGLLRNLAAGPNSWERKRRGCWLAKTNKLNRFGAPVASQNESRRSDALASIYAGTECPVLLDRLWHPQRGTTLRRRSLCCAPPTTAREAHPAIGTNG